jgi:hypothetical protein
MRDGPTMNPLHTTIEEFATDGSAQIAAVAWLITR